MPGRNSDCQTIDWGSLRRHVFGVHGDSLCFAEEDAVAYITGGGVVLYQADAKSQRFIPANPDGEGISALAVCHSKKLLALAERGEKAPTITIFDLQTLKRRKVLTVPEAGCKVRACRGPSCFFCAAAWLRL